MPFNMNDVNDKEGLIPAGTIVHAKINLVPGFGTPIPDATMSRTSSAVYAKFRLDVTGPAPWGGMTLWDQPGLIGKDGTENSFYGQNGRSRLRKYLESACGLEHDDMSPAAMEIRDSFKELNDWNGKTVVFIVDHRTDNQGATRMEPGEILTGEDPEYQRMAEAAGLPRQPYLGGDEIPM
jgi:hypothetical protein